MYCVASFCVIAELIQAGRLDDMWRRHNDKTKNIDCNAADAGEEERRLIINVDQQNGEATDGLNPQLRHLKGGSKGSAGAAAGAVAASDGGSNSSSLSIQQMLGTFVLHWVLMAMALLLAATSKYYQMHLKKDDDTVKLTFRDHGPIIGQPPPLNTYVARNSPVGQMMTAAMDASAKNQDRAEDQYMELRNLRETQREMASHIRKLLTMIDKLQPTATTTPSSAEITNSLPRETYPSPSLEKPTDTVDISEDEIL
jgi:hypothetical protein